MASSEQRSIMEMPHKDQVAVEHVLQSNAEFCLKAHLCKVEPLPQTDCPFYSKIPGEIRTRIFVLVLREFEDKTKPYRPNRVYYRPGYHYHTKQDTRLLQTCRLIYQEARLMPVALTEFIYWIYGGPSYYCHNRYPGRLDLSMNMTVEHIEAIDAIHLFVQQANLERGDPFAAPISCKKFKITLRHSDWWSWETELSADSDDKLGICPWRSGRTTSGEMHDEPRKQDLRQRWDEIRRSSADPDEPGQSGVWAYELQFIHGLETFEMELETDIRKKSQLEAVVDRAKYWRIPLSRESELRWTGELQESTWTGIARQRIDEDYEYASESESDIDQRFVEDAGDRDFVDLQSAAQADPAELTSHVEALAIADEAEVERAHIPLVETPMRTYYVVNMTWDVRKSDLEEDKMAAAVGSAKGD